MLQRTFFYFPCTVSGCDGGNRTRNIVVYTWRSNICPLSWILFSKIQLACRESCESEREQTSCPLLQQVGLWEHRAVATYLPPHCLPLPLQAGCRPSPGTRTFTSQFISFSNELVYQVFIQRLFLSYLPDIRIHNNGCFFRMWTK